MEYYLAKVLDMDNDTETAVVDDHVVIWDPEGYYSKRDIDKAIDKIVNRYDIGGFLLSPIQLSYDLRKLDPDYVVKVV